MAKYLFVLGSFGSGSSALTKLLMELGLENPPPYHHSDDPRTAITYENIAFMELLTKAINIEGTKVVESSEEITSKLNGFKNNIDSIYKNKDSYIVIKHPKAALIIPELVRVFDAKFICILRDLEKIEQSRIRRRWDKRFGVEGAKPIYRAILNSMLKGEIDPLFIHYDNLIVNPKMQIEKISNYLNIFPDDQVIATAANILEIR